MIDINSNGEDPDYEILAICVYSMVSFNYFEIVRESSLHNIQTLALAELK